MPVKSDIVLPKGATLIEESPKQDMGIVLPKGATLIDSTKKKEVGGVESQPISLSQSPSPLPSAHASNQPITPKDWSLLENSFQDVKNKKEQLTLAPKHGIVLANDTRNLPAPKSNQYLAPGTFGENDQDKNYYPTDQNVKKAQEAYNQSLTNKENLLNTHKEELKEPVNTLIKSGHYKDFFDGFGNFKAADAIKYFDGIVKNNKGGGYLRDMLVANLKQAGEYEFYDEERQKLRNEQYKELGINVGQYAPDLLKSLTTKQRNNIDLLQTESKEKANSILENFKPQAIELGKNYTTNADSIINQYKQGQLSQKDANAQLADLNNQYKSQVSELDKKYQDLVRGENIKLQGKYARINEEIQGIEKSVTNEMIWNSIPEKDRKKIETANNNAERELQKRHNEIRKGLDVISDEGKLPYSGLMEKSFRSGWYSGLANIGNYLSSKGYNNSFSRYLQGKQYDADVNASAQYEWSQDPLKRTVSGTGQSLGASAPILLPSVALTLGTAGLGLPEVVGTVSAGLTSYYGETAQNTGEVYKQTLEKTGDPGKAIEAADRYETKQSVMLPLYFLEGAGLQNLLKGGTKKAIIGTAQELSQELPTEYWQNYTQAQETEGYGGTFGSYIKEHPETALDVIAATLGQSGIVSAGTKVFNQINSLVPQSKAQYYADIIGKHGINFAMENLQQQFNTGIIDEKQFGIEQGKIMLAAKKLDEYDGLGLKGEDAKVYFTLSEKANALKKSIDQSTDEGLKIGYENELKETQKQLDEITKGKGAYAIVTLPGGGNQTKIIPIREISKLHQDGKLDELINLSENIEVKGNEEVNNLIQQRKKELGNPIAPEGLYENNIDLKKYISEKKYYQGYNEIDNRNINYFSESKSEAAQYGDKVREVNINPNNPIHQYSNEGIKLQNDFERESGKKLQILDRTADGLKTQEDFFNYLKTKGYDALVTNYSGDPNINSIIISLDKQNEANVSTKISSEPKTPIESEKSTPIENEDIISVGEMMDKKGMYKGQRGIFIQDGQAVVFKVDNSNREYELGNINEISGHSIADYGIETEESIAKIDENGNISVRDKQYVNPNKDPLKSIVKDENGDVVSVKLETPEGERRTFRGQVAEDLAYQITLQEIDKNNERPEFEKFINDDESTRKEMDDAGLSETTEAATTENNGQIQREKIESKTIKSKKGDSESTKRQVSGEIGKRKESKQTESDKGTSTTSSSASGILQAQEKEVEDIRTPEQIAAAEKEYSDNEQGVRQYIKEAGIDLSEDQVDLATALIDPFTSVQEAVEFAQKGLEPVDTKTASKFEEVEKAKTEKVRKKKKEKLTPQEQFVEDNYDRIVKDLKDKKALEINCP